MTRKWRPKVNMVFFGDCEWQLLKAINQGSAEILHCIKHIPNYKFQYGENSPDCIRFQKMLWPKLQAF